MTTAALLKNALGRSGFDASRRWYEETVSHTAVNIDVKDVRLDSVPASLPPLLSGGVLRSAHLVDGETYDATGASSDASCVARLHVRRPLYAVPTYDGLFSDVLDADPNARTSTSALKRVLDVRRFGLVVESLQPDGSFMLVEEDGIVCVDACIVVPVTTMSASSPMFATFYEYIGRSLESVPALTSEYGPYADGALTYHRDEAGGVTWSVRPLSATSTGGGVMAVGATSDELFEGSSNLFFTRERAVDAVATSRPTVLTPWSLAPTHGDVEAVVHALRTHATTDDLFEGSSNLYLTPERVLSIAGSLVPTSTDAVPEGATNVYFTAERALSVASSIAIPRSLDDLSDGVVRLAFTRERVLEVVEPLVTETPDRQFLTAERVLSIATPMAIAAAASAAASAAAGVVVPASSDDITEGSSRLFFTASRAVDAVVAGGVSLDSISDGASRRLVTPSEVDEAVEARIPRTTDSLAEGGSSLYFTASRVLSVVMPEIEAATLGVVSVSASNLSASRSADAALSARLDTIEAWTTADIPESSAHVFHTDARVVDVVRRLVTSDDIRTGASNVYFEDAAAEAAAARVVSSLDLQSAAQVSALLDARLNVPQVTTSGVREGEDNLYFTVERADARVRVALDALSSDDVREGSVNRYAAPEVLSAWLASDVSTDDVAEGVDRLYFTPSRAVSAVVGAVTLDDVPDGSARRVPRTTADITETSAMRYWTDERAAAVLSTASASAAFMTSAAISASALASTDELAEGGTNLYFTSERCLSVCVGETSRLTTDAIADPSGLYFDASLVETMISDGIATHAAATSTLDAVGDGSTRRLITSAEVLSVAMMVTASGIDAALHTSRVVEDASALYFTPGRVLSVVAPDLAHLAGDVEVLSLSLGSALDGVSERAASTASALAELDALSSERAASIASRIALLSTDDVAPGVRVDRQFMTPSGFASLFDERASSVLTTSSIPESSPHLYYSEARCASVVRSLVPSFSLDSFRPGIAASAGVDFEVFRLLLSQCSTDDLEPGSVSTRQYYDAEAAARDVLDSARAAAQQTASSVTATVDARFHALFATKSTSDLRDTPNHSYLRLELLRQLLRTSLTTDDLPQGSSNYYFTPDGFASLGLTTKNVPEVDSVLYFTSQRCRDAVVGVNIDAFVDGSVNRFASMKNVRRALTDQAGIDTSHLAEHPSFRYVSRSSVLELGLRVTDMLGHESFATDAELSAEITSLRASTSDAVLSVQILALAEADSVRRESIESDARIRNELSVAASALGASTAQLGVAVRSELSVAALALGTSVAQLGVAVRSELGLAASALSASTLSLGVALRSELSVATSDLGVALRSAASALSASTSDLGVALRSELGLAASALSASTSDLGVAVRSELSVAASALSASTLDLGVAVRSELSVAASALSASTADLHVALRTEADSLSSAISTLGVSTFTAVASARAYALSVATNADAVVTAAYTAAVADSELRSAVSIANAETRLTSQIVDESVLRASGDASTLARVGEVDDRVSALRTSLVPDAPGSRYVSREAMSEAGVRVSDLVSFSATLRSGFDAAWQTVNSDDLREGVVNRFVSRASVIATGVGIADLALASDGVDARAFSDSNLLLAVSRLVDTSKIHESSNLYFTDERAAMAAASSVSTGGVVGRAVLGTVLENVAVSDLRDTGVYVRYSDLRTDVVEESPGRRFVSREAVAAIGLRTDELGDDVAGRRFVAPFALREAGVTTNDVAETPTRAYYSHDRFRSSLALSATDELHEGLTNLYFTPQRARDAVDARTIVDTGVTARQLGGRMAEDVLTADDIVDVGGSNRFYSHALFEASIGLTTTDAVAEGSTNVYFTDDRVVGVMASPPGAPDRVEVVHADGGGSVLEVIVSMPPASTVVTPDLVVVKLKRVDTGEDVDEVIVRGDEAVGGVLVVRRACPLLNVRMLAVAWLRSAVHGDGPTSTSTESVFVSTPIALAITATEFDVSPTTGCISHLRVRYLSSESDDVVSASLEVGGVVVTAEAALGVALLRVVGVSSAATVSVTTRYGSTATRLVDIPSASILAASNMRLVSNGVGDSLGSDAIFAVPSIRDDFIMNLYSKSTTFHDINRWSSGVTIDAAWGPDGHELFLETFGDASAEIGLMLAPGSQAGRTVALVVSTA